MWIKLWDNLRDWRYKRDPKIMALWVHILLYADWQGEERGTLVTSIREMANETGLSVKDVRTSFQKLCATGECQIEIIDLRAQKRAQKGAQKRTKITICNYVIYQGKEKTEGTIKGTIKGTKKGTPTSLYSEDITENAHARENVDDIVNRIYALYPTSTIVDRGKRSTGKCSKDKDRIKGLLKTHTEEQITNSIKRYVEEQNGRYLKNFSTFLNNLPEYPEEETPQGDDDRYSAWNVLGEDYQEWMKAQQGQAYEERFK